MPGVRTNQVGYLPDTKKVAIIESRAPASQPWKLVDTDESVVASGQTRVHGPDPDSGQSLHWADFSEVRRVGTDYRLHVGQQQSYPFAIGPSIYQPLKIDALHYFYHNRSGTPIESKYVGDFAYTRPAGHLSDRNVPCLGDTCDYALDVSGGWYDAGDFGKYVVNGGIATWTLLDLYERTHHLGSSVADFGDGSLNIPEAGNGVPDLLDEARWEIEFLLKMQVPKGHEKSGMAHHKMHDTAWPPLGITPPQRSENRHLHPPSTAATLNLAAVAAQCARIWRRIDQPFADRCRRAAKRAWNAAQKFPDIYAPPMSDQGGGPYDDKQVTDEFYWAAAELYITLGNPALLDYLRASPHHRKLPPVSGHEHVEHHSAMTWQSTAALGTISLAVVPSRAPEQERDRARAQLVDAADHYLKLIDQQGYRLPMRTGSDDNYPWGSNSFVANNAIILALAHDFTGRRKYLDGVVEGMDYLLGRNPLGLSYVSGYGEHAFENPHHRFWAPDKRPKLPPPPPGVLAGGPNSKLQDPTSTRTLRGCAPLTCYIDHIDAWSVNEVTINWNAPLAWVAAYLDEQGRNN